MKTEASDCFRDLAAKGLREFLAGGIEHVTSGLERNQFRVITFGGKRMLDEMNLFAK